MKTRILTILTIFALPDSVLADPGHIAGHGGGHSHWGLYLLLACALLGFAVYTRKNLIRR